MTHIHWKLETTPFRGEVESLSATFALKDKKGKNKRVKVPIARYFMYEEIRIHMTKEHEDDHHRFFCNRCDSKFEEAKYLSWHLNNFHHIANPKHVFNIQRKDNKFFLAEKYSM